MERTLERSSFGKRLGSMLGVDFRRMFTMPLFYIMMGISVAIPILVLVMTTMMASSVSVDPNTGAETVMEAFDSVWQAIGSVSGTGMDMSLTSMCNINLIFFLAAVLVCIFLADDFRSGYAKNLFTVRARKTDYVISKTLVGFFCGALMLLGFFGGAMLGGGISGLPFTMTGFRADNVVMCMLAKIFLMAIFAAVFVMMGVIGKQKLWLSMLLSLMVGMFLFNIIPTVTPLDSTAINVILCLAGGMMFSVGLGAASNMILKKRDLI